MGRRAPMDVAAEGLEKAGDGLFGLYQLLAVQVIPIVIERADGLLERGDKALALAERGVVALERIASSK